MNRSAPHSQLLKTIKAYVATIGGYEVSILGGVGIRAGTPDLLCAIPVRRRGPARFVAIEGKTGAAVLSAKQKVERDRIVAAGGLHIVARDLETVEHALLEAGIIDRLYIAHIRCEACVAQRWAANRYEPIAGQLEVG